MKKERNINLDIIRIFALLSVVSVHFFYNSGFYKITVEPTKRFFFMTYLRESLMVCVPLFLILTGYLNNKKELNKKYYKSIIPRLLLFFLISFACLMLDIHYNNREFTKIETINYIFHYDKNYSWYVNMYIGLFLIIPFLNILYNNLKDKKQKQILLITLISISIIPSIFDKYYIIIPTWWLNLYPITYYYVGCYLNECNIKLTKKQSFALLIILSLIFAYIIYYKSIGQTHYSANYNSDYYGIMPFTLSVLTFNLLNKIKIKKVPKWLNKGLIHLSNLVFGAYLISKIFDTIVYKHLNSKIEFIDRIYYAPLCILIVFTSSLILSFIANLIVKLLMKMIEIIFKNIQLKFKHQ